MLLSKVTYSACRLYFFFSMCVPWELNPQPLRCWRNALPLSHGNTRYNQGMQNTISERTTRWTRKLMSYRSRRPHRVLLLSAKNRTRRLQLGSPKLDNRRLEKRCLVWWVSISAATVRCRVRIWRKDPSCVVSTVQAGGGVVMVWGIFSWHTLDPWYQLSIV